MIINLEKKEIKFLKNLRNENPNRELAFILTKNLNNGNNEIRVKKGHRYKVNFTFNTTTDIIMHTHTNVTYKYRATTVSQ